MTKLCNLPKKYKETIAVRIYMARKAKNLSGDELSRRLGFNRSYICRVEGKRTSITAERLPAVAAALDVPIEYFYKEIDPTPPSMAARQREKH